MLIGVGLLIWIIRRARRGEFSPLYHTPVSGGGPVLEFCRHRVAHAYIRSFISWGEARMPHHENEHNR